MKTVPSPAVGAEEALRSFGFADRPDPTEDRQVAVALRAEANRDDRPAPLATHPAWCNRRGCEWREEHRSTPVQINPEGNELIGLWLRLGQFASEGRDARPTHGWLTIREDGERQSCILSAEQMRVLGLVARRLVERIEPR